MRLFTVVGDSMRPTLDPGDVVVALRGGPARHGQLRLFRDPRLSTRWMVKRVSDVFESAHGAIFEFRSGSPAAPR